jgi:hypothetical protein
MESAVQEFWRSYVDRVFDERVPVVCERLRVVYSKC